MGSMDGTYLYSPFYPQGGGGIPSTFKIGSFINNKQLNKVGTVVTDITFDWSFLNDNPVSQSILPAPGNIPTAARTLNLTGQNITENSVFTLHATDGKVSRSMSTRITFFHPIFYGWVNNNPPGQAEILAMNERVANFTNFRASIIIPAARSCFVSPMTHPIREIRETVLGLNITGSYDIYDNYSLEVVPGHIIPCRVLVRRLIEDTIGQPMAFDVVF